MEKQSDTESFVSLGRPHRSLPCIPGTNALSAFGDKPQPWTERQNACLWQKAAEIESVTSASGWVRAGDLLQGSRRKALFQRRCIIPGSSASLIRGLACTIRHQTRGGFAAPFCGCAVGKLFQPAVSDALCFPTSARAAPLCAPQCESGHIEQHGEVLLHIKSAHPWGVVGRAGGEGEYWGVRCGVCMGAHSASHYMGLHHGKHGHLHPEL